MLPILLFLGLCFFGIGDCDSVTVTFQGVTEKLNTDTVEVYQISNQTIDWNSLPQNQTAIKEYKLEINKNPSYPDCNYNTEKLVWTYSFDDSPSGWVCVPISYDRFLLDTIESLEQRVSELEAQQSLESGSGKQ